MEAPMMSEGLPCSMITASVWNHGDTTRQPPLPIITWLRGNMDGSFSVNWPRAEFLASLDSPDASMMNTIMQARLIVAGRGRFRECSFAEADKIAILSAFQGGSIH